MLSIHLVTLYIVSPLLSLSCTADYSSHPFFQPYELVDDVVKEERRAFALDLLRYLKISGFELMTTGKIPITLAQVGLLE